MAISKRRYWSLLVACLPGVLSAQPALWRINPAALPVPLAEDSAVPPSTMFKAAAIGPSFAQQVIELVNQQRLANGNLPPLKQVDQLNNAAQSHSDNMAVRDFFSHCDVDTKTLPWDRIVSAGYNWNAVAENIAAGQNTPAAVMASWMGSSGHRANILSSTYWEIGVGYAGQNDDIGNVRSGTGTNGCTPGPATGGPYYHYWTQAFGWRDGVYPLVIEREAYSVSHRSVALYVYGSGWAQDMRFQNEDGIWSAWQAYATDVNWQLTAGNGSKTVTVELRNGNTVLSASDSIELTGQIDSGGEPIYSDDFEN